jgi:hypothetical protein
LGGKYDEWLFTCLLIMVTIKLFYKNFHNSK